MTNRYATIMDNDIVDGEDICVSFWVQGCPHRCKGCHNPETWDFNGGKELPTNYKEIILNKINKNGIQRNFSILGGEPLCPENLTLVEELVTEVRNTYPSIKIFLWTGYTLNQLKLRCDRRIFHILKQLDYLIEGPFVLAQRDITLKWRGSTNQRVINKKYLNEYLDNYYIQNITNWKNW